MMRFLIALALVAIVSSEGYKAPRPAYPPQQPSYGGQQQSYGAQYAPEENYGPDNAQFKYRVPIYDAKTYANADVNVNRYPGGAAFEVQESGKGSDVQVKVETSAASGYKQQQQAAYKPAY